MNGVQTRFKCKLDVKRCKRFVFPPSSLLPRSNALKTKAIRYFQTDRTLTRIVSPPLLPEVSGQADSPEDTLISEELFARYVKALDRLPERCREVFIRLREEKQSYAQVAEELNISTKTVDAQLQKALTRLKEALLTE